MKPFKLKLAIDRRNFISILSIFILMIALGWSIVTLAFTVKQRLSLLKDLKTKESTIKSYRARIKFYPSEESVNQLKKKLEEFKRLWVGLESKLVSPLASGIEDLESDPLKFKEHLFQTQRKVRQEAEKGGVELPPTLGFDRYEKELIQKEELPLLSKQLVVLEELLLLLNEAGVYELKEIDWRDSQPLRSPEPKVSAKPERTGEEVLEQSRPHETETQVFEEIVLNCSIESLTDSLIRFLSELSKSEYLFVVKDLKIEVVQEEAGEAEQKLGCDLQIVCKILSPRET